MAHAKVERTVRFRARHHYRRPDWSAPRNREVFGPVAVPHEHDYVVSITVRGEIDRHGFAVDLAELDASIGEIVGHLEGSDLNTTVFGGTELQPTTEALARWFWEQLVGRIPGPSTLARVRVAEDATLAGVWGG